MYGVLQRRCEQIGDHEQERLTLSFDTLFPRERDTALGDLFGYWREKRLDRADLPDESHFMSREMLPVSCRIHTAWVDADTENPFDYVIRKHPSLLEWGDRTVRRVGELDSMMNAKSCAMEYMTCIRSKKPMYHEITQTFGSDSRHYIRLLLPLFDGSNNVTRLFYAVRIFSSTVSESASSSS